MVRFTVCILISLFFLRSEIVSEELIVGLSEYPPYYYSDSKGRWDGLSLKVLRKVTGKSGLTFKVIRVPWSRAFKYIEVGEIDIMLNVTRTKEREKIMDFIGMCSYEQMALIVRKENKGIKISSLSDLKRFAPGKFGIQKDYFYPQISDRIKKDEKFREVFEFTVDSQINIKKTLGGRILGFFDDRYFAIYATEINMEYKGLSVHPFTLNSPKKVYIVAGLKTDPAIRKKMKRAHRSLMKKGVIEKIVIDFERTCKYKTKQ